MNLKTRKKNRLVNFDYSRNGAYFITICTKNRVEYLSIIENHSFVKLTNYGIVVEETIQNTGRFYNSVYIDKYVIMPNHIHMIIRIENDINERPMVAPTISNIINQMKGYISKKIGFSIWQKSFHDHIIRNEKEYAALWNYIEYNPCTWENDCLYVKTNSTTYF